MAKSKFSWTAPAADMRNESPKENRQILRESGVSASSKTNPDGSETFTVSGDEEKVGYWRRMISG